MEGRRKGVNPLPNPPHPQHPLSTLRRRIPGLLTKIRKVRRNLIFLKLKYVNVSRRFCRIPAALAAKICLTLRPLRPLALRLISPHGEVPVVRLSLLDTKMNLCAVVPDPEKTGIAPFPAQKGLKVMAKFWLMLIGELAEICPKIPPRVLLIM